MNMCALVILKLLIGVSFNIYRSLLKDVHFVTRFTFLLIKSIGLKVYMFFIEDVKVFLLRCAYFSSKIVSCYEVYGCFFE